MVSIKFLNCKVLTVSVDYAKVVCGNVYVQ